MNTPETKTTNDTAVAAKRVRPAIAIKAVEPKRGAKTEVSALENEGHGLLRWNGDAWLNHYGSGTGPSGSDYIVAAVAQCILHTLLEEAHNRNVALTNVEVRAGMKSKMTREKPMGYATAFAVDVYVEGDVSEEDRQRLEEYARDNCYIRNTLVQGAEVLEKVHVGSPPDDA